jgi:hypothetical protein
MSDTREIDDAIKKVVTVIKAMGTRPQTTAIKITKSKGVDLRNVGITGFDTAIEANETERLTLTNVEMTAPEGSPFRETIIFQLQELEGILQNLRLGEGDTRGIRTISDWLKTNAPEIFNFLWVVLSKVGRF